MKARMKKLLTMGIVSGLLAVNAVGCYAAMRTSISIYPNKVWSDGYETSETRSMRYSSVYARNISVYPDNGGTDTFSKIHVRVETQYGTVISDETALIESSTNTEIDIYEGYLDTDLACFSFRGNSNSSAVADVYYDAR